MGILWADTGAVGCIVIMSLLRVRVWVFYFMFCKLTEHNHILSWSYVFTNSLTVRSELGYT